MHTAFIAYLTLITLTAFERLAELRVSKAHLTISLARGGIEYGFSHYPFMVLLHTGLLIACVAEVWFLQRPFLLWLALPMLLIAAGSQALRWWCIRTLGPQWNTRVIVIPNAQRITHGPYRYFAHPNYLAVVLEGIALPLIHTAWMTALVFTLANALLLFVRLRTEEHALATLQRPHP